MPCHLHLPPAIAAVLLCGGRSTRMGQDKARLDFHGEALWLRQWHLLQQVRPLRCAVACRQEQGLHQEPAAPAEAEWLFDPQPHHTGTLGILSKALSQFELPLLLLAVDLPRMTSTTLHWIIGEETTPSLCRIPKHAQGFEPLAALYTPQALPMIEQVLQEGDFKLQHLAQRLLEAGMAEALCIPETQQAAFCNVNHPEDWQRLPP